MRVLDWAITRTPASTVAVLIGAMVALAALMSKGPYKGFAAIWNYGLWQTVAIFILVMPVAVGAIAWFQGTLGWRNPALWIADPFCLAPAAGVGLLALAMLPRHEQRTITSISMQVGLALFGWTLGTAQEWLGRWQGDKSWQQTGAWEFIKKSYAPSDVYHFALYGPLAAVLGMALVAAVRAAIVRTSIATIGMTAGIIIALAAWGYLSWLTGEMMKAGNGAGIRAESSSTQPR